MHKMDQSTLLVDVGNSSVKWTLFTQGKIDEMEQCLLSQDKAAVFFIDCWKKINNPEKVLVTCVASEQVWQAVDEACQKLWNLNPEKIVSLSTGYGVVNAYENAADLGSDRWCAIIAGGVLAESNFIVISCGSAITIDIVERIDEKMNRHLGGYILPGLGMMKHSLGLNTAKVKVAGESKNNSLKPAKSTAACVAAGINLAVVKTIEAVVEEQTQNHKKLTCIISGGDAIYIKGLLSVECMVIPDLVLQGLAYIAKNSLDNKNIQD